MGTINHPRENDLALLAGGDAGRVQRYLLDRHVRSCVDCQGKIAEYRELRSALTELDAPDLNWNFLAADMRANIRLGLEAGECVRTTQAFKRWNVRPVLALASVLVIVVAGEFLRDGRPHRPAVVDAAVPVLQSTVSGVEVGTATNSLMLLNHRGNAANQTVSAQGNIEARYVDSDTGALMINNVYLQ
jgi:hypothetical protein